MKPSSAHINRPRRIFLAVVVVLVLVLAWELSKEWRTGIEEHRIGNYSNPFVFIRGTSVLELEFRHLRWSFVRDGSGIFELTFGSAAQWDVAPYAGKDLRAVTPADARVEFHGVGTSGHRAFGMSWRTNEVLIQDGQILLVRHGSDRETVYAIQVVEQFAGAGRFRSRKILPAPNKNAPGRQP